jgi:hypothetical protein
MACQEKGRQGTGVGKDKKLPPFLVIALVVPLLPLQIRNSQETVKQGGTYLPTQQVEIQGITPAMEGEVFMHQGLPHREGDFLRYPQEDLEWMQLVEVEGKANILETHSILWIEGVDSNLEDLNTLVVVETVDIVIQKC